MHSRRFQKLILLFSFVFLLCGNLTHFGGTKDNLVWFKKIKAGSVKQLQACEIEIVCNMEDIKLNVVRILLDPAKVKHFLGHLEVSPI